MKEIVATRAHLRLCVGVHVGRSALASGRAALWGLRWPVLARLARGRMGRVGGKGGN